MIWRTEWKAISDQIQGILDAGKFYISCLAIKSEDTYSVANRELIPQAEQVFETIKKFRGDHQATLPLTAASCLNRFIDRAERLYFKPNSYEGLTKVQGYMTALTSFRSEFTYQISEWSFVAKRLSERAFTHLQRSIVADKSIRDRWKKAFKEGEPACEKLGGAHLLLHGIWAFKAGSEGERTDLVFSEKLTDLSEAEKTAEALVLTEWKLVRPKDKLEKKAELAKAQAARYAFGSLAGFELTQYRYLVLVSEPVLTMPEDLISNDIKYLYINIAVDPKPPSKG